ncbi:MAG: MBL fold metallo-hydrolase [Proteobacteria bacterium]|nr:MAG: MBL fold metallo-hydrolase [Pseudomonadota bacterium]
MPLRLFGLPCGWLESDLALFVAGARGAVRVPVPSWLVLHPRGAVVFDSGLHLDVQTDAAARLGDAAQWFRPAFRRGDELAAHLRGLDVDPDGVRWLVSSHLHFDHVGGNAQLPNAAWVVQRREWEAGCDPELRATNHFDPRDYDLGHARRLVDGEHDLFGDGAITCLPTHGHTPGHQSLRVALPGGDVVLTADACYLRRSLDELRLPPLVHDREAALASLQRLRALEAAGARLHFGHDPAPWANDPHAPREVR